MLLDPDADRARITAERTELAKGYLDVREMQHSTYFESGEARVLDQPLRRLTQAAVELCTTAEAAASHRGGSLRHPDDPTVSDLIRAADDRDLGLARARLRDSMAAFDRGEELPEPKITCGLWSDPVPATLIGIRSALAVGITSTIWFATAWPNGLVAVIVAGVVCSLLASLERPDKVSMAAAATILVTAAPVFATQFHLMPLSVDFVSMAVALAPLMLASGFIMAHPRIGPLGLLSVVYFVFASNISNVMTYDATAFLNASLALLVGIAVAVVLFAVFFPETPAGAARRLRRQLLVHLSRQTNAYRSGSAFRCYQLALLEQLGTTLASVKDEPKVAHECLTSALTALSAAQAIGRLKTSIEGRTVTPAIAAEGARLLARLSQTLRSPSVWRYARRAAEARALARHALAAARGSAEPTELEPLNGVVVGAATLGSDLMRARLLLEGRSHAVPI